MCLYNTVSDNINSFKIKIKELVFIVFTQLELKMCNKITGYLNS
jgi:hypothetical protein